MNDPPFAPCLLGGNSDRIGPSAPSEVPSVAIVGADIPVRRLRASGQSATLYILSRARDQNWGPTYLRRPMSDCPCSGKSSVGVTWPTSMPGVTDVLMYFISPAAN